MFNRCEFYLTLLILAIPLSAKSEIPLTVENLLSDEGRLRMEVSATYANSERRGLDIQNPITLQTGPNSFVAIPTVIGERSINAEAIVSTVGVRYGIAKNSEVYGRASMLDFEQRSLGADGSTATERQSRFVDSWVGVNHKFSNDIDNIGLLGFAEVQSAQKQMDGSTVYGKSKIIGATLYQTYDPIVLSLTAALQLNDERMLGSDRYKPGDRINISPSIGFAANDKVTLSGGMNWRNTGSNTRNGVREGIRTTSTSMDFGVAYALSEGDTLNFKMRPKVSGDDSVQMTVGWSRRFISDIAQQE